MSVQLTLRTQTAGVQASWSPPGHSAAFLPPGQVAAPRAGWGSARVAEVVCGPPLDSAVTGTRLGRYLAFLLLVAFLIFFAKM